MEDSPVKMVDQAESPMSNYSKKPSYISRKDTVKRMYNDFRIYEEGSQESSF